MKNPEVKEQARTATRSLVDALSTTFSEIGEEFKNLRPDGDETTPSDAADPGDGEADPA